MKKSFACFLTLTLLFSIFTINALAIRAPDSYYDSYCETFETTSLTLQIIGLAILLLYIIGATIYYFVMKTKPGFSIVPIISRFVPVCVITLICFAFSRMPLGEFDEDVLMFLCFLTLCFAPMFLLVSTMINVIKILNAKQEDVQNYKTFVQNTIINVTVFFVLTASSIFVLIFYGQIL